MLIKVAEWPKRLLTGSYYSGARAIHADLQVSFNSYIFRFIYPYFLFFFDLIFRII